MSQPLARCFAYALAGLWEALRTQRNLRVHLAFTLGVVAAGWVLALSPLEWAILALTVGMVWVAELFNTAMEAAVDLASPTLHPLARKAKDVSAAAVLVAAISAVAVGLIVLVPHVAELLQ